MSRSSHMNGQQTESVATEWSPPIKWCESGTVFSADDNHTAWGRTRKRKGYHFISVVRNVLCRLTWLTQPSLRWWITIHWWCSWCDGGLSDGRWLRFRLWVRRMDGMSRLGSANETLTLIGSTCFVYRFIVEVGCQKGHPLNVDWE